MDNIEYNGWTNWATWNVNLWLTNESDSFFGTLEALKNGENLEDIFKAYFPEGTTDITPDDMNDVNWEEIKKNLLTQ